MSKVSIYLNFQGQTEEAFRFYQQVFQTELSAPFLFHRDLPQEGGHALPASELDKVMHVALPILGGTEIMGTDMLESMGHKVAIGNNTTINLVTDSKEEADRLYQMLSAGATDCAPMSQQFWGYWGCCLDRFGIRWMINFMNPQ